MPHEELEDHDRLPDARPRRWAATTRPPRSVGPTARSSISSGSTGGLVDDLPDEGPGIDELRDLRRVLYSLHAILDLHMAQEEELYLSLGDEHPPGEPGTTPLDERSRAA